MKLQSSHVTNIAWFVAYLGTLAVVVLGLRAYRSYALKTYGSTEAESQWQNWREAAEEMGRTGPVRRQAPRSAEPPALVLMRDHFSACLGISLLLSSCLFAWFMISARGAMRPVKLPGESNEHEAG